MTIDMLNKICIYTLNTYTNRASEMGDSLPEALVLLRSGIITQLKMNPLSKDEALTVLEFEKDETLLKIVNVEVSYIIFAMELAKLWTTRIPKKQRPNLNVSDKRFLLGGRLFFEGMVYLKLSDKKRYDELSSIITQSIDCANEFFEWHYTKLFPEEKIKIKKQ